MSMKPIVRAITRETLKNWRLDELSRERDGAKTSIATEDQLLELRHLVVADYADVSDLWVFGYSSVIYNTIIDFSQRAIASIYGYCRRFCLWTIIGRRSPRRPGLL